MRAQLIEFTPDRPTDAAKARSANMALTIAWQPSKSLATAKLCTLGAPVVVINSRWTGETRSWGWRINRATDRAPANAAAAAPPVSPDVAQTTLMRSPRELRA